MEPIPYPERIRLGCNVPTEGQFCVMRRIPQFHAPEMYTPMLPQKPAPETVRAAVFNVEHGYRIREIASFLRSDPVLKDADILFGNELDDGTQRSGNIDASRVLAEQLGYQYAYSLEFIELVDPNDQKGYEGNTLFSRWPIVRAESLYLPEAYNWYYDEQKRIGARVAVLCELDIAGKHLGAVCVHLENRTSPEARAMQVKAILEKAATMFSGLPVLIGGDFNTNAFDYGETAAMQAFERQKIDGLVVDPTPFEPLFVCAERAGFDFRSLNGTGVSTRRRPTGDGVLALHLDWIFGRGVTCVRHGTVSTLLADCARRPFPDKATFTELSDHNAVWADVRF